MKIVIIGASFAGLSAALECHSLYPEATIVLIDKEEEVGYFPNALNWKIKGAIKDWQEARTQLYEQVRATNIDLQLGRTFHSLYPKEKSIAIEHHTKTEQISYDYLILAMGAKQVWESQEGEQTDRVLATKSLSASLASLEKLEKAETVTIIGAGQIGLESLDAFQHLNVSLRLIEAQDWPLAKYFDQEMSEVILSELESRDIDVHFSEAVNRVTQISEDKVLLETRKGYYETDYLVVGTNFRPNTDGLESLLELHSDGSVLVDDYLQTTLQDIFAIGDMIQLPFAFFGRAYLPLINHAILTGRLVAHNLLTRKKKLKEVERIISSHLFGYNLTSVGLTEREADLWLETSSIRIRQAFSQWDHDEIDFKLVVSKEDGRLLGGQLVSKSDHIAQMNVLAMAISQQLTVADLLEQSWLCLPGRTALVPFILEAAHMYQLEQEKHGGL